VRSRLALAIIATLATVPAFAQDTAAAKEDKPTELDTVVVTGSRKPGLSPTETLSPVDTFGGDQVEQQSSSDLTDSLTKITPSLNTQRFPIADGTAFVRPVTLRNLAPDQTLVLVNGARRHRSALVNLQLAPLGTVNQGAQAVDFSAIPSNAIKRVEVLRDGSAVLYGSDAIAGVINVILDDSPSGGTVSLQSGEYTEGDGDRLKVGADAGWHLGPDGFVRVSYEHDSSNLTSRGHARPDAAAVADIVGADQVPYNGLGQRWGDPDIDQNKVFVNAGFRLNEHAEVYGFGSYTGNDTLSGFFYRDPVILPPQGIHGRSTLIVDNDGDFLPDEATAQQVADIIAAGGNPADFLTPSTNPLSATGWVLLNPIYTQFPGGYSPLFGADIKDHEIVVGLRGDMMGGAVNWDLHGRTASNEIDYVLNDSINPSLGRLSPTTFRPGTLTQEETEWGIDFTQSIGDSDTTLAYGALWRNETYIIGQGDEASIAVGPAYRIFGVGSDGFQGFFPGSSGEFSADSASAYVDLEGKFTDKFSAGAALRYEKPEDFDSELVYKVSARYAFTDTFALRGTYNTGFRTPTPGQLHTLNVTTTADSTGNLIPSGTYPVDNPIAQVLGAESLKVEKSRGFTLGMVWDVLPNVTMTLDYYRLKVDDRIGLVASQVDQAAVDALTAAGYPDADLLLGSAANFFGNAFDSDIRGWDFVVDSRHKVGNGTLNIDFRHNYNRQEVENIDTAIVAGVETPMINGGRAYDLEHQVPRHRSTLTFDYANGAFGGLVRANHYGGWSTTPGLFGVGDASDAASYGGKTLVDLEARWKFSKTFSAAIGADNVFDTYPDKEKDGTLQFLGQTYAITSPFGFNGRSWYVRVSADW
jgi:iron complex outermembrane receptor protein